MPDQEPMMPAEPERSGYKPSILPMPLTRHILGHAGYSTLVTSDGTGWSWSSAHGGVSLHPWAGDAVEDRDGLFIYLRDVDSGHVWSSGLRPTFTLPEIYDFASAPGTTGLVRSDAGIHLCQDICVDPSSALELRSLRITNESAQWRTIEVTSYAEIALAPRDAFRSHPAFSKLFLETSHDGANRAILARRRRRGDDETHPVFLHAVVEGGRLEHETSRALFLGRGRDVSRPAALEARSPLSGKSGFVLDGIASFRRTLQLGPREGATTTFVWGLLPPPTPTDPWGVGEARAWLRRLRDGDAVDRVFERAAQAEDEVRTALGLPAEMAEGLQALAGAALYGVSRSDARGGTALARLPFLVVAREDLLEQMRGTDRTLAPRSEATVAHRYWRALGLPVETLIVSKDHESVSEPEPDVDGLRRIPAATLGEAEVRRWTESAHIVVDRPMQRIIDALVHAP